ncbi:MAG: STAS domain-containing protein [Blastococcus sp.]|nr:STAS domain-containing protein [Blastococcus sp.]
MSRHIESGSALPGLITVEAEGDRRILCLRGDIDSAVVARFNRVQGRELPIVDAIDAGDVSFLSSTGIAVLLRFSEAAVAAGRDRPALRSASPVTTRVLELAGLDVSVLPR